jgi:hypothetical protein
MSLKKRHIGRRVAGVGVYSPAHFPSGSVLGARGKGVSEEGGSRESSLLSRERSKKYVEWKVRTML